MEMFAVFLFLCVVALHMRHERLYKRRQQCGE